MVTETYQIGVKPYDKFRLDTVIGITIFHIGAILAPIYSYIYYETIFTLVAYPMLALLIWPISHGLGLAVGYHRLLTHRGFDTPKWVEYTLTVCGLLTLQSSHIKWIAVHRRHHQETDTFNDPHSPRNGFMHSHIGWMIYTEGRLSETPFLEKYAKDLMSDPVHRFFHKFWWLPSTILALVLFAFDGIEAILWGIFIPVAVGLHFTWLVNSVCHKFGSRMFETDDDSKNNWWVALLTFGEGWHNNHHDKPVRARHGLHWYQIDFSWMLISVLKSLGLAKNIKL
jgi:stearoyl-CoA desaturase (delta-9 desaturase)